MEELYQIFLKFPNIATDTRKIEANTLFFALKGVNFDGNQFAEEALKKGAAFVVTSREDLKDKDNFFFVADTLVALQKLARYHRDKFLIPVLAITGSNGKTTTKELLASIFSQYLNVHFTSGNFNNHIGVPLTLLKLRKEHGISIIEMGANRPRDIAELCEIANPTHGVITNIGKAHLEGFGSLEGVIKTKTELYEHLRANKGVAFVNMDEAHLKEYVYGVSTIPYETYHEFVHHPTNYEIIPEQFFPTCNVSFLKNGVPHQVKSHLFGHHNFENIKTAIAICSYFKVPVAAIIKGVETYVPANNRSELVDWGTHKVFLDAYNANPSSMRIAIKSFQEVASDLPKMLVLGDMKELGADALSEHQAILNENQDLEAWSTIILVGAIFPQVEKSANVLSFKDVESLKEHFPKLIKDPHFILVKGSRSIALEKLIQ